MRYLLPILLASLLLISCGKSDDPAPAGTLSYVNLPNWDTRWMLADIAGGSGSTQLYDSIYAYKTLDVAYIRYRGEVYNLKAKAGITTYPVNDTAVAYYIGVFNASGTLLTECLGAPGKYYRNGALVYQSQSLALKTEAPFTQARSTPYYSR